MRKIIALLMLIVLLGGCASFGHIAKDEDGWSLIGKTYYTKFNIWFNNDNGIIYSVGRHIGEMLPAGTKVRVDSYDFGNKKIDYKGSLYFKPVNVSVKLPSREVLTLRHDTSRSNIEWAELLDKYFSEQNITEEFNKFTEIEKLNIKNGNIAEGMSKEAVLMAWGYPHGSVLPDLSFDMWEYYVPDKRDRVFFYFTNDKINSILTADSLTLEQVKKTAIREIKGRYEDIYEACKTAFVDRGYVIKEKDKNAGLIIVLLDGKTARRNRLVQSSIVGKLTASPGVGVRYKNMELNCMVNKINNAVSEVKIWDNGKFYPEDSRNNYGLLVRIRYYDKLFNEITKEIQGIKSQAETSVQTVSSADELLKYKKLLDNGAITKEEYEQKKEQLLGL